jgi:hypothetical protein
MMIHLKNALLLLRLLDKMWASSHLSLHPLFNLLLQVLASVSFTKHICEHLD